MLTKAQKRVCRKACKVSTWLDDRMTALCDDPMTEAMGAPIGDFYEEWSRRHRSMIGECIAEAQEVHAPQRVLDLLFACCEPYMP